MINVRSFLIMIVSILIVLLHVYIGHYFAPKGIDLLPITMTLITILMLQFSNFSIYFKCLFIALMFLSLDLGIKLYAGGSHDLEGLDWMNFFYFIGLIISSIIITYKVYKSSEINSRAKILIIVTFVIFQYFQINLFWNLGLGRYYSIN